MVRNSWNSPLNSSNQYTLFSELPSSVVPTEVNANSNLVLNIKSANSSYELFEIVSLKKKEFTDEHIIQALRTLFILQKNEKWVIYT